MPVLTGLLAGGDFAVTGLARAAAVAIMVGTALDGLDRLVGVLLQ